MEGEQELLNRERDRRNRSQKLIESDRKGREKGESQDAGPND